MIAIDEWSWLKNRLHAERVEAKEMIMAAGWYAIAKRIVTRTTKETLTQEEVNDILEQTEFQEYLQDFSLMNLINEIRDDSCMVI